MTVLLTITILLLALQDNLVSITGLGILSYFDELLIILLVVLAIFRSKGGKRFKNIHPSLIWLLVAFAGIGIISCAINSEFVFKNVVASCFLSIKYWLIIFSASSLKANQGFLDSLYKGLFVVEIITILFAVVNMASPEFYMSLFPDSHVTYRFGMISVCSIFNHPGKYGWFMLFCALAHLSIYDKTRNRKELFRMALAIVACLLSLRTKIILGIAACAIGYLLFVKRATVRKQIKKIAFLVVLLACLLIPFSDIVKNTYVLYFTDNEGYSVRQALSDNSVKIATDYFPIGVGFGKYGTWYAARDYSEYYHKYGMSNMYGITKNNTSYSTDTFWPALLGETGYIGSAIYILMISVLLKSLVQRSKKNESSSHELLLMAPLTLILTIVESFGSASFSAPPEYFMAAFVIGLSFALNDKKPPLNHERNIK